MFQLIQKNTGEGIVCAIGKDCIHIAPIDSNNSPALPAPKSCNPGGCGNHKGRGSCGGCLALVSVDNGYVGEFHIPVKNPENFKLGDRVHFRRFVPEPNLASTLVFGVPVVFAAAVMLYLFVSTPQKAESALAVLSVIAAFFGGLVVLGILDKLFKRKYPAAVIDLNDSDGGER